MTHGRITSFGRGVPLRITISLSAPRGACELKLKEISRNPFEGIGKPEPLKDNLSGFWSRRIDDEHRLVYAVENDKVLIISCKGHYNKK